MRIFCKAILGILLATALLTSGSGTAAAFPPSSVTGIDLPTVLTLDERARRFAFMLDDDRSSEKAAKSAKSLKKIRTIVLDPGHGGENLGALGVVEIQEKYLTLELAYELRERLQQKYPYTRVLLTRYWDRSLTLVERVHFANMMDADIFMSLHYNAAVHNRAVGFETYFLLASEVTPGKQEKKGKPIATAKNVVTGIERAGLREEEGTFNDALLTLKRDLRRERQNRESGLLAETVQHNLAEQLDTINRGVKQANFGVLRGALMPAVVVESGFLTHPVEGMKVAGDVHRDKVVDALIGAVEDFDRLLVERASK
jgi:N-acetylmuramoyl-L-alanine amidase